MPQRRNPVAGTSTTTNGNTVGDNSNHRNDDLPPLTTYPAKSSTSAETQSDRIEALRLIADSVAQQRQQASKAVILHPSVLAAAVGLLAVIFHFLYHGRSDLGTVVTTMAGCVMAGMAGVGYATSGYLEVAERTGTWAWLSAKDDDDSNNNREEDILLVTKYGNEIIGTVVLRLLPSDPSSASPQQKSRSVIRAVIRAWTVQRRYRHRGIGTGLLEEAVALCRKNDWEGPVFDAKHANATRILPRMFDRDIDRREEKARVLLENVKAKF